MNVSDTIRQLFDLARQHYNVLPSDILGSGKTRTVCFVRFAICHMVRQRHPGVCDQMLEKHMYRCRSNICYSRSAAAELIESKNIFFLEVLNRLSEEKKTTLKDEVERLLSDPEAIISESSRAGLRLALKTYET